MIESNLLNNDMKKIKIISYRIILALSLGLFASCAAGVVATYPDGGVVVAPGPPPFVGAVWIGGEYRWSHGHYVSAGGRWSHPRSGRTWTSGNWQKANGGYRWSHGYWK
jgi:hypothetical protein